MITKDIVKFNEFGNCLKISDGITEALITIDFGPRIIRYGFIEGENVLCDTLHKNEIPLSGEVFDKFYYEGACWNNYGGHRLWISPESLPETYYPDKDAAPYELTENGAIFTPKAQIENGVQHIIDVHYEETELVVSHKVINISENEKEFAVWALSVSALNGIEIIPFNTNDTGLLHNRQISIWPYTDLRDERIYLGHKYATIIQKDLPTNLKIGFNLNEGKVYYVVNNTTFKVCFDVNKNGVYPDNNVCFETYSCKDFTEIETLSELKLVKSGESITHNEKWSLFKTPCEFNAKDDDSIDNFITKLK